MENKQTEQAIEGKSSQEYIIVKDIIDNRAIDLDKLSPKNFSCILSDLMQ